MMPWKVFLIFCGFAFVSQFVPNEPFLSAFLLDDKHFTEDELNNQIYSVATYTYLGFLLIVGPTAELIGYKTLVIINILAHIATRGLLIWGQSLALMQLMQATYGLAIACEVVFFAFVYKLIDKEYYQMLTSWTRSSVLFARVFSGILAQILVTYAGVPLVVLSEITFATSIVAFFISLTFPRSRDDRVAAAPTQKFNLRLTSLPESLSYAANYLKDAYSDRQLLAMSIWWWLAQAGLLLVEGYAASLWYQLDPTITYNGYVDAIARLIGAFGALLPTVLSRNKDLLLSRVIIVSFSIFAGVMVSVMAITSSVWVAYGMYIGFEGAMYCLLAVIATKIAKCMSDDRFAVIFGLNTFGAAVLCTIVQVFVSELHLSINMRFAVYGGYWILVVLSAISVAFVIEKDREGVLPLGQEDQETQGLNVPTYSLVHMNEQSFVDNNN